MSGHEVRFEPVGREVVALAGETILDVAARAGLNLAADCGGRGVCGACRVNVDGLAAQGPSRRRLNSELLARGDRLACLTPVVADLVVHLPARFQPKTGQGRFAVLASLGIEAGTRSGHAFGVAARGIGTGTAADLIDLRTGRVVVGLALEDAGLATCLRRLVEEHGFQAAQVQAVAVTAETLPAASRPSRAAELGLAVHERAPLFVIEACSSGIEASLLAGAVAAGMGASQAEAEPIRLYVDFGQHGGWVLETPAGRFGVVPPAACEVLLTRAGIEIAQVGELVVAGGLGDTLDVQALVSAGRIPDELRTRVRYLVEDSTLQGLRLALVSEVARDAVEVLTGHPGVHRSKGESP